MIYRTAFSLVTCVILALGLAHAKADAQELPDNTKAKPFIISARSIERQQRPSPRRRNLLQNPGFEVVEETGIPTGWTVSSQPKNAIVAADDSGKRSGKAGLRLEFPKQPQPNDGNDIIANTMFKPFARIGPGFGLDEIYTFSCYVKTKGLDGFAYLEVHQYTAPLEPGHQHRSQKLTGDHDWTRLSVTFRVRDDLQKLQLRCGVQATTPAKQGAVWFDDARLELGDKPTGFAVSKVGELKANRLSLWLDRKVYTAKVDPTAVGLLEIQATGIPDPDDVTVQFTVFNVKSKQTVINESLSNNASVFASEIHFDLSQLVHGTYQVAASLMGSDGQVLASDKRVFVIKEPPIVVQRPQRGRIRLRVWAEPRADGVAWPVSTGVPFARGALPDTSHVRLLRPDKTEAPCQLVARSTWSPFGSVQWLGVDFVPTLDEEEQGYVLEYGRHVRSADQRPGSSVASPLVVEEQQSQITVNTGPLKFTVNRDSFKLIDNAWLDIDGNGEFEEDEQVVAATDSSGPQLVDHGGNCYLASRDHNANVVVEETGPVKTVIRATGWYVKEDTAGENVSCELPTDRLCRFTFRITAWAGQADLQVAASTFITYDSEKGVASRPLTRAGPEGRQRSFHRHGWRSEWHFGANYLGIATARRISLPGTTPLGRFVR